MENSSIRSLITTIIGHDNTLTQIGIQESMRENGVHRSQSFLSRNLNKLEYTRKKLSLVPYERSSLVY